MKFKMEIFDAEIVKKRMLELGRKKSVVAVRKATRAAQTNVTLKNAKRNAAQTVGGNMGSAIAKAMAVRVMTKLKKGSYGHKVIVKDTDAMVHEAKYTGVRSYIPNAIEYGHAGPYQAGGMKVAQPKPFMRPAFEESRRAAFEECIDVVKKEMGLL